jgi:uncharacterized protein with FMN-binding domain
MRRITLWLLSSLSALVLLFGYHTSTSSTLAAGSTSAVAPSSTGGSSKVSTGSTSAAAGSGSGGSGSGSGSGSSGSSSSGSSSSGTSTVTGAVADTQWGPVQVQLTLTGGTITKVSVLQYPNGNGRDAQINSYALPILIDETTQAQSAQIDMVSGATVTSTGYLQSLQSALDKAGV